MDANSPVVVRGPGHGEEATSRSWSLVDEGAEPGGPTLILSSISEVLGQLRALLESLGDECTRGFMSAFSNPCRHNRSAGVAQTWPEGFSGARVRSAVCG